MNEVEKKAKLRSFMSDTALSETVYSVLLDAFLKPRVGDISIQAAAKISIDNLGEAWKELQKYKKEDEQQDSKPRQPGL